MKKTISLNVIGTALVVSVLTSSAVYWAEESLKTPSPSAQQTAFQDAETDAVVKEVNDNLMKAIRERELARNTETYNGMASWYGNDIISQGMEEVGARFKRVWSDFIDEVSSQVRERLASEKDAINGGHS